MKKKNSLLWNKEQCFIAHPNIAKWVEKRGAAEFFFFLTHLKMSF